MRCGECLRTIDTSNVMIEEVRRNRILFDRLTHICPHCGDREDIFITKK
ncbi:MAG: hypothetical protein V3V78_00475 [Candidatus Woesearchaeota archaeon]